MRFLILVRYGYIEPGRAPYQSGFSLLTSDCQPCTCFHPIQTLMPRPGERQEPGEAAVQAEEGKGDGEQVEGMLLDISLLFIFRFTPLLRWNSVFKKP